MAHRATTICARWQYASNISLMWYANTESMGVFTAHPPFTIASVWLGVLAGVVSARSTNRHNLLIEMLSLFYPIFPGLSHSHPLYSLTHSVSRDPERSHALCVCVCDETFVHNHPLSELLIRKIPSPENLFKTHTKKKRCVAEKRQMQSAHTNQKCCRLEWARFNVILHFSFLRQKVTIASGALSFILCTDCARVRWPNAAGWHFFCYIFNVCMHARHHSTVVSHNYWCWCRRADSELKSFVGKWHDYSKGCSFLS